MPGGLEQQAAVGGDVRAVAGGLDRERQAVVARGQRPRRARRRWSGAYDQRRAGRGRSAWRAVLVWAIIVGVSCGVLGVVPGNDCAAARNSSRAVAARSARGGARCCRTAGIEGSRIGRGSLTAPKRRIGGRRGRRSTFWPSRPQNVERPPRSAPVSTFCGLDMGRITSSEPADRPRARRLRPRRSRAPLVPAVRERRRQRARFDRARPRCPPYTSAGATSAALRFALALDARGRERPHFDPVEGRRGTAPRSCARSGGAPSPGCRTPAIEHHWRRPPREAS